MERVEVAIVGAGAAGLMTGIWAGRTAREAGRKPKIVALDGAKKIGAKILVAGGGRCNVTHDHVDETAYAGASKNAIRKVLRRFDAAQTIAFFREIGVELKREETGKMFPVTDSARTVLDALLAAARQAGVDIRTNSRVGSIERTSAGYILRPPSSRLCLTDRNDARAGATLDGGTGVSPVVLDSMTGETPIPPCKSEMASEMLGHRNESGIYAQRVVLATGGMSLPKTGSDGGGYALAKSLGHTITPRVFPALAPLTAPVDHFVRRLAGVSTRATVEVRNANDKRIASFTDSILCTHFGLSGPAILDISRYWLDAQEAGGATLVINWLPGETETSVDQALLNLDSQSPVRWLTRRLPERLARELCLHAGVDPSKSAASLRREERRRLVCAIAACVVPIAGSRGFKNAEATAGGAPLTEVRLETMESRCCPGLYLVGEVLDVDGRIGGYNFQWAWATGYICGAGGVGVDWNQSALHSPFE